MGYSNIAVESVRSSPIVVPSADSVDSTEFSVNVGKTKSERRLVDVPRVTLRF